MSYGKETVMSGLRKAGDAFGAVDDAVQGAARYVLGERDGKFPENPGHFDVARRAVAETMHGTRKQVREGGSPEWEQNAYLLGTRAAQAGGITAAGYGLHQLATQFGGQADQPEPNQLPLQ